MPAKIASIISGETTTQALIYPDRVACISIYDAEEDSDGVVVVLCDAQDTYSDIYLFPVPDGFERSPDPNELMPHCDAETFLTQIEHGDECHIETGSRHGNLIEFVIEHSFTMSDN